MRWIAIVFAMVPMALNAKVYFMAEAHDGLKQIASYEDSRSELQYQTPTDRWALYPHVDTSETYLTYSESLRSDTKKFHIVTKNLANGHMEQWGFHAGFFVHSHMDKRGRLLAYAGKTEDNALSKIFIVDVASERAKVRKVLDNRERTIYNTHPRVLSGNHDFYFPRLSSGGHFIVYQESRGNDRVIKWQSLLDDREGLVSFADGKNMAPVISADDRFVIFTRFEDGEWDLYQSEIASGKISRITRAKGPEFSPTFNSVGDISFSSNVAGRWCLYLKPKLGDSRYGPRRTLYCSDEHSAYSPTFPGASGYFQGIKSALIGAPRSSFGIGSIGDNIYVVGGHMGKEHTYPPESFSNSLHRFNMKSGDWKKMADLSVPRHGFSVLGHEGKLYAFGGFAYSADHKPKWQSLDIVEVYDPLKDAWQNLPPLRLKRSSNVAVRSGDEVYLIGGWDSTPKFPGDYDGIFREEIEVYNLNSGQSRILDEPMKTPKRRAFSAVSYKGKIILVGGLGEGASHFELLDNVTSFDPSTGQWQELPPLPFPTFAPAAGVIGDNLYVFGGMFKVTSKDYIYVNHIYRYDFLSREWTHTSRYLTENKGFAMVTPLNSDSLGIIGGHSYDGKTDMPVSTFEVFGIEK